MTHWRSGGAMIEGELWRSDNQNRRLANLTDFIVSGSVNWNADRGAGVKLTAEFSLSTRDALRHRVDYFAPVLRLTWDDGVIEEQQFGLFLADLPDEDLMPGGEAAHITGLDPTWLPWQSPTRDTTNVAAADVVTTKAAALLEAAWPRVAIPVSTRTFGVARSWFPGERRYDVAAAMLSGMNWHHPYSDLAGVIRSGPVADLQYTEPALVVGPDDPIDVIKRVPSTATLGNIVTVRKENTAQEAAIVAIAENNDPASATSTVNMPETLIEVTNADIQTQGEADVLAAAILRTAGTYYRVVTLKVEPGVWPRPYQVLELALGDPFDGRYHIREWRVGFTPRDGGLQLECNQIAPFVQVAS